MFFYLQTNHYYPNIFRALCNMKRLMTILARQILFVRPLIRWKKWGKLDELLPNMQSKLLFSILKVSYFEIRYWLERCSMLVFVNFWPNHKKCLQNSYFFFKTKTNILLIISYWNLNKLYVTYKLKFYHDFDLPSNSFKFLWGPLCFQLLIFGQSYR